MNLVAYPRKEWALCNMEKPNDCRRVLIWHRVRKWCRFQRPVIGWWNGEEWRTNVNDQGSVLIYQPTIWRDIEQWNTRYGFPKFE